MKKFRVYFATKDFAPTRWFRSKKDVSETEYVVVSAFNEAHASKEAKKHVDMAALSVPFTVTRIEPAAADEAEGCHGNFAKLAPPPPATGLFAADAHQDDLPADREPD
ncbi:MAG: hypothetical protein AAGU21_06770 [Solidesulfovibrio sp.]|uniref:hypothetical protein n=1 Tax=Solidesulfovibrio sp. TaxID=2910990 RepID=UPI002B21B7F4|nr:hypothetical protein [Solidesulfovibrio sp.]MEA4856588.1 hypothetical protein [Solidesulfovibrio sp.]